VTITLIVQNVIRPPVAASFRCPARADAPLQCASCLVLAGSLACLLARNLHYKQKQKEESMTIHYRKAAIDWQSDTMRILTPLLYLVYSLAVIVMMGGMIYAARLLVA
jgi:hypothetical protein